MIDSISKLSFPVDYLVEEYSGEANKCFKNEAYIATIIISASCLESALRERLRLIKNVLKTVRDIDRMDLVDLIDWSRVEGYLDEDCQEAAHKIRLFRNFLTHPKENYDNVIKKYPPMEEKLSKISAPKEVKNRFVFKSTLKELAEETINDTIKILKILFTDFTFPGLK